MVGEAAFGIVIVGLFSQLACEKPGLDAQRLCGATGRGC
jgi:hypothetical protein